MSEVTDPPLEGEQQEPLEGEQQQAVPPEGTGQTEPSQTDKETARKLKETKAEAQALRKRLREAEETLKAKEDADLTETERLRKHAESLEAATKAKDEKLRVAHLKVTVTEEAQKLGFRNVQAAIRLVKDDVEYDDDGQPTNVTALLEQWAKDDPQLVQPDLLNSGSAANARRGGVEPEETDAEKYRRLMGGQSKSPWTPDPENNIIWPKS